MILKKFLPSIRPQHLHRHCNRCTDSSTTPAPTQSSKRQKGHTKPVPYWGSTKIKRQPIIFSDHGEVARLWWTPVPLWHTDTRLLESLNYRMSTPKYYGQLWHRKVAYLCDLRSVLDRSSASEVRTAVAHTKHEAHCGLQRRQTVCSASTVCNTEIERVFGASMKPT
jgi:hypothetical protein